MSNSTNDEHGRGNGKPPPRERRDQATTMGRMVAYSHVAYMFIGSFGIPTALGIWLDAERGTSPWGVIIGVGLGLVLSTVVAWREIRTSSARMGSSHKKKSPPRNS